MLICVADLVASSVAQCSRNVSEGLSLVSFPRPRSEFEAASIRDTREELGAFLWSGCEVGALHGVESVNGVAHAGLEEVGFGR